MWKALLVGFGIFLVVELLQLVSRVGMFDLDDLMRQIEYFSNVVESLSGGVRTKRVARVVPRDL